MKNKYLIILPLLILLLLTPDHFCLAKGDFALTDISISVSDVQYGLPFVMALPIHPGIEVGTSYFKHDNKYSTHTLTASLGYYYHSLIAYAIYLNSVYDYQQKIAGVIGLNVGAGIGMLYSIFPRVGYLCDEDLQDFIPVIDDKLFAIVKAHVGISYIKPQKIQPFVVYEFNYFNVWEMSPYLRSTAILKAGIKINL